MQFEYLLVEGPQSKISPAKTRKIRTPNCHRFETQPIPILKNSCAKELNLCFISGQLTEVFYKNQVIMKDVSCSASPSSFSISLFTTSPIETIPSDALSSIKITHLILFYVIISTKSEELTVFRAKIMDLVIIAATFSLVISRSRLFRCLAMSGSETIPMTSSF